ncbi:hypothetical protein [Chitinophaga sp. S165]|uniref:hypothetical protein n=1 Tax=Chitinophaga sp. S165 TaxID=2135462 RepID=UPI000D70C62E|nr:hypothetical protein [Chitinophaga sp. S165]PWV50629.1 hypothetical protein C7475_104259 [Chitinophaga sp. S165]
MLKFLPFLLILSAQTFAQTENVLQHIRDRYQEVNKNITSYKVSEISMPGISAEGASLQGYFIGDSLQLMVEVIYETMGKERTEVYYDKGALVFCYSRGYKYKVPMYDSTFNQYKWDVEEERAYFHGGKLVRWMDANKKIFTARDAAFIEKEKGYLERAANLYKIMFKHRYDGEYQEN